MPWDDDYDFPSVEDPEDIHPWEEELPELDYEWQERWREITSPADGN